MYSLEVVKQIYLDWISSQSLDASGILTTIRVSDIILQGSHVFSVEDCVIPPYHEAIIKARGYSGIGGEGILVPVQNFVLSHGLAFARVVVNLDAEGNCIFLRVFNPFEEEVRVKENTAVAFIEPVECVSSPVHVTENVSSVDVTNRKLPGFLSKCS